MTTSKAEHSGNHGSEQPIANRDIYSPHGTLTTVDITILVLSNMCFIAGCGFMFPVVWDLAGLFDIPHLHDYHDTRCYAFDIACKSFC